MTDYKEEQSNELEALESIYPDELEGAKTCVIYTLGGWGILRLLVMLVVTCQVMKIQGTRGWCSTLPQQISMQCDVDF